MKRIEIHAVDHCVQKCNHCSHAADLAPDRMYGPEDYVPWFDHMAIQGIGWDHIDILGGEPFLNPRLYELVRAMRPYCTNLGTMTNVFWLRSEADIEKHRPVLRLFKSIVITLYPPLVEKCGGLDNVYRLMDIMREEFPRVDKWYFGNKPVDKFAQIHFYDEPREIVNTACELRHCAVLRAEGYIIQCCAAMREPTHKANDLTFDISGEIDKEALERWLSRPMLDLCRYCTIATDGLNMIPWTQHN